MRLAGCIVCVWRNHLQRLDGLPAHERLCGERLSGHQTLAAGSGGVKHLGKVTDAFTDPG